MARRHDIAMSVVVHAAAVAAYWTAVAVLGANLVYLVAFGLLVVMLVVEIVRSATGTSL